MRRVAVSAICLAVAACSSAPRQRSFDLAENELHVTPEAREAATRPDPNKLVAHRGGPIMIYSGDEQAALKQQRDALVGRFGQQSKDVDAILK